jgi:hypothetical protein
MFSGLIKCSCCGGGVITEYVTAYNAERKRLKREAVNERARLERRNGEIEREINRLVDSIAPAETIAPGLREMEAERVTIRDALKTAKEADNVITLHPQALARYKRNVTDLAAELKRNAGKQCRRGRSHPRSCDGDRGSRRAVNTRRRRPQGRRGAENEDRAKGAPRRALR